MAATGPTTRTAAAAVTPGEYNAFLAGCPSRQLLDRISDKWVTLVLCALAGEVAAPGGDGREGPRALRYAQLSRLLVGVSQKMLTQTLRALERDGLLTRSVTPTVPVTVSYELTDLGLSLHQVVGQLRAWAQANMDAVTAHRAGHLPANTTAGPAAEAASDGPAGPDQPRARTTRSAVTQAVEVSR